MPRPRRLALMNLYLHGIEPHIRLGDSIYEPPTGERFDVILAEQERIAARVESLLKLVSRAKERLNSVPLILNRFRQAVLAMACSGDLTREWRGRRSSPPIALSLPGLLEERRRLWERRRGSSGDQRARRYPEPFQPVVPDDFELPDHWSWVSVSHLALLDVGFAFKSAEFAAEGVRLLRGENVEPGSLRWAETRFWPEDRLDEFRELLVEAGEIILALDRPIVSAGLKIARVKPTDTPALLVQRVMRFKMIHPAHADYLYLCLSQRRFIDFVAHEGMTGSDLPHITGTGVAEFAIPLPPADEQLEIVRRAAALFALADAIEHRLKAATFRANSLPQAILSKAFAGELVPTEAEVARAEGRSYGIMPSENNLLNSAVALADAGLMTGDMNLQFSPIFQKDMPAWSLVGCDVLIWAIAPVEQRAPVPAFVLSSVGIELMRVAMKPGDRDYAKRIVRWLRGIRFKVKTVEVDPNAETLPDYDEGASDVFPPDPPPPAPSAAPPPASAGA